MDENYDPIVVRTKNHRYRLGAAGLDGYRDVTRDDGELTFTRGRLMGAGERGVVDARTTGPLEVGKPMAIMMEHPSDPHQPLWITSEVTSIEPVA